MKLVATLCGVGSLGPLNDSTLEAEYALSIMDRDGERECFGTLNMQSNVVLSASEACMPFRLQTGEEIRLKVNRFEPDTFTANVSVTDGVAALMIRPDKSGDK